MSFAASLCKHLPFAVSSPVNILWSSLCHRLFSGLWDRNREWREARQVLWRRDTWNLNQAPSFVASPGAPGSAGFPTSRLVAAFLLRVAVLTSKKAGEGANVHL